MAERVQWHNTVIDVTKRASGDFSGMNELVYSLSEEALGISNPKVLTVKELPVVTDYNREAYLAVSLLLSCNRSVYRNLIEDMGNS